MCSWRLAHQRAVTFAGAAILAKPPLRELLVRRLRTSISSELVSFSVTPAEGGASGFVIAVAVR